MKSTNNFFACGRVLSIAFLGLVGCAMPEDDLEDLDEETPDYEGSEEAEPEDWAVGDSEEAGAQGPIEPNTSSTCIVGSSGTCTTAIVPAHATGHFIDIAINNRLRPSPCSFYVRDTVNRQIIFSGTVGVSRSLSQRLNNVFSQYLLHLHNCSISARGFIDNT